MSLKSGHKVEPLIGHEGAKVCNEFEGVRYGAFRTSPGRWFFSSPYLKYADKIYNFEVKKKDVIVMSFPKSGSTWTQEIIWTLLHNQNLDNPEAIDRPIYSRSPCIECDIYFDGTLEPITRKGSPLYEAFTNSFPDRDPNDGIYLQMTELSPDSRVYKTHLPFELLPPSTLETCKVVYIVREPKDVIVSYYKFSKVYKTLGYLGMLDSYVDHFLNGRVFGSPYWANVKQAWDLRHHPNLLFVYYEELVSNPVAEITRMHNFLGLSLTQKQISNIVSYTSFDAMKKRENLFEDGNNDTFINREQETVEGGFFNKGKVGTWKERLTEEQILKINEWTRKNVANFEGDFKYKKI